MKNLTDRELATVIFALRYLQANLGDAQELMEDSDHFAEAAPLNDDEIDTLAERLNFANADVYVPEQPTQRDYEMKKKELEAAMAEDDSLEVFVEADGDYVPNSFAGRIVGEIEYDYGASYYVKVMDQEENVFSVDIMMLNFK